MEIQLHAPVVSSDGVDLGKVEKVIFDPETSQTRSIVVRKGFILARDVAVPTEHIRVAAPSRVELDMSREEIESLPDFVEDDYRWPPQSWVAPYGWPAGSVLWPTAYVGAEPIGVVPTVPAPVPREVEEMQKRRDLENAVVGEGAEVVAMGGEKVGSVHNVLVDPATRRPSRVVVKRGLLFTEDVELPGEWIDSVDDERVTLNVDKVTVEQLAKRGHRE
ncbi:MAG TPA: PRC-barrel domain-containing protein [Chloroflexota bacterium]